jgi:hypothetical protein
VFTALTVDAKGALNVAWLDLSTQAGWQGPVPFGAATLHPGAPVAVFQQTRTVFTALTVGAKGMLNVAWLDLSTQAGWQGPVSFGPATLQPGGQVSVFKQSDAVFTALTVDAKGALNVAWLDLSKQAGWQGPVPFGPATLQPGAPVTVFQQSNAVFTALTVGAKRALNVAWLDLGPKAQQQHPGWHTPVPFGSPGLAPGAPVAEFRQSPRAVLPVV